MSSGLPLLAFPRGDVGDLAAALPYPLTRTVTEPAHVLEVHCALCDGQLSALIAGLEQPGPGHAPRCPVAEVRPGQGMVRVGSCPQCQNVFEVPAALARALQGAVPCPRCELPATRGAA